MRARCFTVAGMGPFFRIALLMGLAWGCCGALAPRLWSAEPFYLRGGETVLFFGDSITQGGAYVTYVDLYLRTRFPDRTFRVINHGISSETISGTTEPDHDPPRPHADKRFTRDVAEWRPDVLVACFGMNDGNYHPFEEERYRAYQAGIQRLLQRTKDEIGPECRVSLLTAPPYDPYQRKVLDPLAQFYGYKFPAVEYDETLRRYAGWLVTQRRPELIVADVHTAITAHVQARRRERVSFTVVPDAVHPNATGHWLMAQTLLSAWQAPAEVATARIDAAAGQSLAGEVSELTATRQEVRFRWKTPLPLAIDPDWDAASIAHEQVDQRLNRAWLQVAGLQAGEYRLQVEGQELGHYSAATLEQGVNLGSLAAFAPQQRSLQALKLLQQRNRLEYDAWRKRIAGAEEGSAELGKAARQVAAWDEELAELCRPLSVLVEVGRRE